MNRRREVGVVEEQGWRRHRYWITLATIATVGAAVRLWSLFAISRPPRVGATPVWGDGFWYDNASNWVASGRGFSSSFVRSGAPDTSHPPLWTSMLAAGQRWGLETVYEKGLLAVALGIATILLIGVAGRVIVSKRVGLIAASIAALYPGLWIYERNLNAEALAFPLIALTIILSYRYRDRPTPLYACALAATAALLALTRAEQVLVVPFVVIPLILGRSAQSWPQRLGRSGIAAATYLLLLSPWTLYNLDRTANPVVLSTGSGAAMVAGTCDTTFRGDKLGTYDSVTCFQVSEILISDPSLRDVAFRSHAIDYTLDHLGRLPAVVLAREGRSWTLYRPGQSVALHADQVNSPPTVAWMQILTYWVLLPLAVAGTVVLRRRRTMLYPLLAFPAIVVVASMATFGDVRYRAAAEVSLVLLASFSVDAALAHRSSRRARPASDPALSGQARVLPSQESKSSA